MNKHSESIAKSNTCPLPAPTNIKEALLLQKQIKLNYISLKSISQKTAEKSSEN